MSDKFVLIAQGVTDSPNKGVVRLPPQSYDKIYDLHQKTGMSMGKILEQCVDFALEHLAEGKYEGDE